MANSIGLLEEAWKELQNWVNGKKFDPHSEADIQSFLYHCLIKRLGNAKGLACAPHPHKNDQTDLSFENKLFVENKHILRSGIRSPARWELRRRIAEADIKKLAAIKRVHPDAVVVLTVFAESYSKKDEPWYDAVEESCEKLGIVMLRAWKPSDGREGKEESEGKINVMARDEEIVRKMRLAFVLGVLCRMYDETSEEKEGVGGDVVLFAIPPEVHAEILNEEDGSGDPYEILPVTEEEIVSILKSIYGKNYDYFLARGLEVRKVRGKQQ